MRKLITSFMFCFVFGGLSSSYAQSVPSPSVNFLGYFGLISPNSDLGENLPSKASGSRFAPILTLAQNELIKVYRDDPGVSVSKKQIKGFTTIEFDYVNPNLLTFGTERIADPPSKGIYIYLDKKAIGYMIIDDISIDHGYDEDSNLKKIKHLPAQELKFIPGTTDLLPEGIRLIQYSVIKERYIEKYVFISNSKHQSLLTFSYCPQTVDDDVTAQSKAVFQVQIASFKKWKF